MRASIVTTATGEPRLLLEPDTDEERAFLGYDLDGFECVLRSSVAVDGDEDGKEPLDHNLLAVSFAPKRLPRCPKCRGLGATVIDGEECCDNGCGPLGGEAEG